MPEVSNNLLREIAPSYRVPSRFPALHDPRYPVHKIGAQLEPYVSLIVEKFHPVKIILFGSQACGQPNEHSDVDLLVIRRDITVERESNIEIRRAFGDLRDGHIFSFTILSKTPERIANRLSVKSPFYEDIVGQGIELYAEQADR